MSRCTAVVLQNYPWAEWRVTRACTSDQKAEQIMDMQTGRVFTRHTFFLFCRMCSALLAVIIKPETCTV